MSGEIKQISIDDLIKSLEEVYVVVKDYNDPHYIAIRGILEQIKREELEQYGPADSESDNPDD